MLYEAFSCTSRVCTALLCRWIFELLGSSVSQTPLLVARPRPPPPKPLRPHYTTILRNCDLTEACWSACVCAPKPTDRPSHWPVSRPGLYVCRVVVHLNLTFILASGPCGFQCSAVTVRSETVSFHKCDYLSFSVDDKVGRPLLYRSQNNSDQWETILNLTLFISTSLQICKKRLVLLKT